jgi:hypothetical protein
LDSQCWVIPIEFIEILGALSINLPHLEIFKEKWSVFVTQDPNVKPYLKSGYRDLDEIKINAIATSMGIDLAIALEKYSFDPSNNRLKKYELAPKDRLVIAIWEKIFRDLT